MAKRRGIAVVALVATLALASLTAHAAAGSTAAATTWKIAFVNTINVKPPGACCPPGPAFRHRLFVVNADGSGRRLLATSMFTGSDVPSWSPDGRRIAFGKRPGYGGSDSSAVFVVRADGSAPRNLTRSQARDVAPSWSPDGRRIAFLKERRTGSQPRPGGYHELWVMNADGSGQRRLTGSAVPQLQAPRWSPDSGRLAVDCERDGDVCIVDADGSEQRDLTETTAYDGQPDWSRDGRKIAFVSDRDGNGEIYVMNADGSHQLRLTSHPASDFQPAWSTDGRRIVFVSSRDGNPEIYVMNADGSGQRRLTRNPSFEEAPAWTPDGRIAFASRRSGNWGVYVMNADGSGQIALTGIPAGHVSFAWSPARTARSVWSGRVVIDCEGPWGPEAARRIFPQGRCQVSGAITDRGRFEDDSFLRLTPHGRTLKLGKGTIEMSVYLSRGHWEIDGGTREYAGLRGRGWEARSTRFGNDGLSITMKGTVSR